MINLNLIKYIYILNIKISSPKKTKCSNCDKEIETNKFFLHDRFCAINVRKYSICKEPVQKNEYEGHKSIEHAVPNCASCHKAFPNTYYESHIKNFSKKIMVYFKSI